MFWNMKTVGVLAELRTSEKTWILPKQHQFLYLSFVDLLLNATIEERVSLLEVQVVEIQEDVTGLGVELTELDENVDFLCDEQIIHDEKLLYLEQETEEIDEQFVLIGDEFGIVDDALQSKFVKLIFVSTGLFSSRLFVVVFATFATLFLFSNEKKLKIQMWNFFSIEFLYLL